MHLVELTSMYLGCRHGIGAEGEVLLSCDDGDFYGDDDDLDGDFYGEDDDLDGDENYFEIVWSHMLVPCVGNVGPVEYAECNLG